MHAEHYAEWCMRRAMRYASIKYFDVSLYYSRLRSMCGLLAAALFPSLLLAYFPDYFEVFAA